MESYGERTQTHTFENHANLLTYLAKWPLYFPENGFQGTIKCQGSPFLVFAQVFSALIVRKNCQNGLLLKKKLCVLSIDQLHAWAHRRSTYAQLSPLYPSLYPYVTHVINYSRPSPAFPYWKRRKAGRGLGTRLGMHRVSQMLPMIFVWPHKGSRRGCSFQKFEPGWVLFCYTMVCLC